MSYFFGPVLSYSGIFDVEDRSRLSGDDLPRCVRSDCDLVRVRMDHHALEPTPLVDSDTVLVWASRNNRRGDLSANSFATGSTAWTQLHWKTRCACRSLWQFDYCNHNRLQEDDSM
jgi:hypothetical protein